MGKKYRQRFKKGGSFPEFPSCTPPEFLAHFLGHYLEMHLVSQFLVHFVHLSGRAQLAHSAFSCYGMPWEETMYRYQMQVFMEQYNLGMC